MRSDLRRHLTAYPGCTVLVTHDPLDAMVLADRLVVLEHGRVVQAGRPGEVFLTFPPSAVALHRSRPEGSARNVWPGRVAGLEQHGDTVRVQVAAEPPVLADVTPAAVAELDLTVGSPVWAAVKATEVHGYPA